MPFIFSLFLLGGQSCSRPCQLCFHFKAGELLTLFFTAVKQPPSPKPILAESAICIKCSDGGDGIVGRSSGPAHREPPESPKGAESGLHLGSEEVKNCRAPADSHSASLSVPRKPRCGFCASRGTEHFSQRNMAKPCLAGSVTSEVTWAISFSMLLSLGSGQGELTLSKLGGEVRGVIRSWRQLPNAMFVSVERSNCSVGERPAGQCTFACKVLSFSGVFTHT